MNAASNGTVSGGISGALVIIANWLLTIVHIAPMPTDVSAAWAVVLTGLLSYYLHLRSTTSAGLFLATPKPAAPAATPAA